MSYSLVGNTYIGTGTLPTPVAGYMAQDTSTGALYASNTSASAWTLIGNVNSQNLGALPLSGGAMTGSITGATGWAPLDSPNFTTSAKLAGVNLATQTDLTTMSNTILNSISPKISEAVASTSTALTFASNVARATGILTFNSASTQTIPLPNFPDGTTATEAQCKWFVGLVSGSWPCGRSDSNGDTALYLVNDPSTTRTFAIYLKDNGGNYYTTKVMYFIEGIRS